ncbi:HAD family hydrolase [Candidatus Hodarchaeum mangrovi]
MDKISYLLFDFDGTIVDSMKFLEENAIFLLNRFYNFPSAKAKQSYRQTTGLPFIQQMEIISPETPSLNGKIVENFEKMKIERIYEQELFPEVPYVLTELKKRHYRIGISSGTYEHIIRKYFEIVGIKIIDDILGYRNKSFEKGKSHFDYILKKWNLKPFNIIFIGDSLNDARRAKDNKIRFIGRIGLFNKDEFNQIIPNIQLISNLSEILPLFPSIGD